MFNYAAVRQVSSRKTTQLPLFLITFSCSWQAGTHINLPVFFEVLRCERYKLILAADRGPWLHCEICLTKEQNQMRLLKVAVIHTFRKLGRVESIPYVLVNVEVNCHSPPQRLEFCG